MAVPDSGIAVHIMIQNSAGAGSIPVADSNHARLGEFTALIRRDRD